MKIVVYSCISGVIDSFKPEQTWGNADWIMFTDQPAVGGKWEVRPLVYTEYADTRKNARMHKTQPEKLFPNYDYSIWIDGSMKLNITPEELIKKNLKTGELAALTHPDRDCPYEEAEACKRLKKDSNEVIDKQMDGYINEGFMRHQGLAETKIVIRENNPVITVFDKLWCDEIRNRSLRDQLSFNYCAWLLEIPVTYIPSWKTNTDFTYFHHDKL